MSACHGCLAGIHRLRQVKRAMSFIEGDLFPCPASEWANNLDLIYYISPLICFLDY